jgi:hypothetical protein
MSQSAAARAANMGKVRVLVANRPRLMREMVLITLADQPDIQVVGEARNDDEISELVDRIRPDFVIITLQEPESSRVIFGFLLRRYPEIRIIAIAPEKNLGVYYGTLMNPGSHRFKTSEQTLLGVLRGSLFPDSNPSLDERRERVN